MKTFRNVSILLLTLLGLIWGYGVFQEKRLEAVSVGAACVECQPVSGNSCPTDPNWYVECDGTNDNAPCTVCEDSFQAELCLWVTYKHKCSYNLGHVCKTRDNYCQAPQHGEPQSFCAVATIPATTPPSVDSRCGWKHDCT